MRATEIENGQEIWILSSTYHDPEEEYGVDYIVGMFLSEKEARDKAEELGLGMFGIGTYKWGSIRVRRDIE